MALLAFAMHVEDWAELITGVETRHCWEFGVHVYRRVPTESDVATTLSMDGESDRMSITSEESS